LDQDGEIVDPKSLDAREGRKVFAAKVTSISIPTSKMEAFKAAGSITISPEVNELVLKKDDTHLEVITVRVPGSTGVSKADVYFLADTTVSMGGVIAEVRDGASFILNELSGLGLDMAFGIGNYRDFPHDDYAFEHQLNPTTVIADADSALNSWTVEGGWDGSEGQLFALDQLAESPGGSIGWRTGSKRIIVWFGDMPGHDPVCQDISGLSYDISEESVTHKLIKDGIIVLAISTRGVGLDGDPTSYSENYADYCTVGGAPNQATRITEATGGTHVTEIDATKIVETIIDLVITALSSIGKLTLVPTGDIARFVTSISPSSGYGPLDSDMEHTVRFDVQFVGVETCGEDTKTFSGTIDAVADSVVVASKRVNITVPDCEEREFYSYSVPFVCGRQEDCGCTDTPVRPGIYATSINIHNFSSSEARIIKLVLPTVFASAPAGREPRAVQPKMYDTITLRPNMATMDDCCRISELLLGARPSSAIPLTLGFMEFISPVELQVSAIYTVTDLNSNSISMNVEQITGRLKPLALRYEDLERLKPIPTSPDRRANALET
jgi:hypothetical protein